MLSNLKAQLKRGSTTGMAHDFEMREFQTARPVLTTGKGDSSVFTRVIRRERSLRMPIPCSTSGCASSAPASTHSKVDAVSVS